MFLSQGSPCQVPQEHIFKDVTVFRNLELDGMQFNVGPGMRLVNSLLFFQTAALNSSTPKTWMKLKRLNIEERSIICEIS